MNERQHVYMSMKDVMRLTGLARATIDRLRRRGKFPDSYELVGSARGRIGFLAPEVWEWMSSRRKRTLTPLA